MTIPGSYRPGFFHFFSGQKSLKKRVCGLQSWLMWVILKKSPKLTVLFVCFLFCFFFGISYSMGYMPNSKGLQGMNDIDEG